MKKINKDYLYLLIFILLGLGAVLSKEKLIINDRPPLIFHDTINKEMGKDCKRLNLTIIMGAKPDRELRLGQQFYYYTCYTEIN